MNKILIRLYKYYLTYVAAPLNRLRRRWPDKKSVFIAKFDGRKGPASLDEFI